MTGSFTGPRPSPGLGIAAGREGDRVTTLELFFDLVFVYAFTQVTTLMGHGEPPRSVLQGAIVLALLWWAWSSYAWLANHARANRGLLHGAFIVAIAAMFVGCLGIPEAFHEAPGGLRASVALVSCYAVVRAAHLAVYFVAAGGDAALRHRVAFTAGTSVLPTVLILGVGALLGEPRQTWIWLGAVLYDFAAIYLGARRGGWVLPSTTHFVERHGLVTMLALGESIVAVGVGVGVAGESLDGPIILGALFAISISVCLWREHFHGRLEQLERALLERKGQDRAALATEVFTYLHFAIVAGIILAALGIEQALGHLHEPHLGALGGWALPGGIAMTLFASAATLARATGHWPRASLAGSTVLWASAPVAAALPPLAALGTAAGGLAVLGITRRHRP